MKNLHCKMICIYLKAVPLKIKVSYHIIQQFYLWVYTQELKVRAQIDIHINIIQIAKR